jgi:ubiquinone/menaquinone biosynthesis C-methylase UbiE
MSDPIREKSWADFYKEDLNSQEFLRQVKIHEEFFNSILSQSPKKILEAGCGSALFSIFLSRPGYDCTAVDLDSNVLRVAKRNSQRWGAKIQFSQCDIRQLPFNDQTFDVSFSQGVLEHFTNEEIMAALDEQLRVAKTVIFSVPHLFYRTKDFGNERLLFEWQWKRILRKYRIMESRCYYRIRRKKNFFLKLPQMYYAKIKAGP